jgi:hypothetical protein
MATISVDLPQELYERLQQAAEQREQSLEAVLVDGLSLLFGTPLPELSLLDTFTDEMLKQIIRQRLSDSDEEQMETLLDKGNQGILDPKDKFELDRLIATVNRQMLLRSEAFVILKKRGHDINKVQFEVQWPE